MATFNCRSVKIPKLRITAAALVLLFTAYGLCAAAQQEVPENGESFPVTDMRGREVQIPGEVSEIIALDAGALRLVSYLGATDMVTAVEDEGHGREKTEYNFFSLATYRIAFPGLRELPVIGSRENHEGIIAAAPDLIITSTVDAGQLDHLQEVLGIPVFAVNIDVELFDTELFYDQIKKLGLVLGRQQRAEELINGIDAALGDLENRKTKVTDPGKAYAGGMMYYGPADLLRTTGDYLPFDLSGTINVMPSNPAGNRQPYMTSIEDLIAAAPEYIFIDSANINLSAKGFTDNRRIYEDQVPAFAEKRVYSTFAYKYYGTNWENQLINVYYIGKVIYPQLYSDVSISDKAEEIWLLFFGVPLDFDKVAALQKGGPGTVDWLD